MIIYTDGSAHPNPGPGGFGVIVLDNDENLLYTYNRQFKENITNNQMEIKAILYTFLNYGVNINKEEFINNIPIVYSDSNYCVQTFNNWMFGWANKGWIKSDKKTPENLELIKAYYDWYQKGYRIDLRKVKGHNGIKWNEIVDQLATGKISSEEVMKRYGTNN